MESTITSAAREYANRPKDERFPSVAALVDKARHDRELSVERDYNTKDLKIVAEQNSVRLASSKGSAKFSHWSFGQFARMIGAPAGYLRDLPASIAADAMNFGIQQTAVGDRASMLVQAPNGTPEPLIRSCTSDSYARLWDSELYSQIGSQIVDRDSRWTLPPTWSGESAGAYRGDRDSFLILTNGGSIVNDPSASGKGSDSGGMYRGILVRNSEVGAAAVTIETILFRYVCGNHMLWGASVDKQFRRRHVGTGQRVLADTAREIGRIAFQHVNQSAARDEAIIRNLIDREIASTKEAVIDELRAIGATKEQATAAYERCEQTESASPRSFWGSVQGLTRISQDSGFQDERFSLDLLAAKLLSRGTKLVAA